MYVKICKDTFHEDFSVSCSHELLFRGKDCSLMNDFTYFYRTAHILVSNALYVSGTSIIVNIDYTEHQIY